jgi:two-component system LytT family response regulator
MITCIVIDDQKNAIEALTDHIKNYRKLHLLQSFTNPLQALTYLEDNRTNLIFMDVQMPHMNGLEFIETLRDRHGNNIPYIILTTGFDEYALPGFEHGVVDYLLKPIGSKRFKIAMDRFFSRYVTAKSAEDQRNDYFFADTNSKKQKINYKDVSYIESAGNYVIIHGDPDLKVMVYISMNSMQEVFPRSNFMRIHKSYIVSIDHIHAIKGSEIMMNKGAEIVHLPMGVTFKSAILKRLKIKE